MIRFLFEGRNVEFSEGIHLILQLGCLLGQVEKMAFAPLHLVQDALQMLQTILIDLLVSLKAKLGRNNEVIADPRRPFVLLVIGISLLIFKSEMKFQTMLGILRLDLMISRLALYQKANILCGFETMGYVRSCWHKKAF